MSSKLIEELTRESCKTRPMCTWRCGLGWMLFSGTFLYYVMLWFGVRSDLLLRFENPVFKLEILSALVTGLTAALAASWLSTPDVKQQAWPYWLPFIPLVILVYALAKQVMISTEGYNTANIQQILFSLILCVVVPGVTLFAILKRAATTRFKWVACMSTIAIFSFSHTALRLMYNVDQSDVLLNYLILPNLLLSLIISLVGTRSLRW
jgi:hypothetical protein